VTGYMAMAKDEKEEGKNAGTVAAAPKKKTKKKAAPKRNPPKQLPPWKVLLHNDDVNDFVYVVETIVTLTPLKPERAIICMKEAHESGLSLLLTTHKERAELYQEQFQSKGLTVTIEPAE
jgi:ATP-dependent Clp protease adaptor protein ClpS